MSTHFEDRDALSHVVEKKVAGFLSLSESHGTEMPGHLSSCADALRETALFLFLLWFALLVVGAPPLGILIAASSALIIWKTGRSARLGWARLERLHRVMEQEKYEIENNRDQEREELSALYRAKGFEGKLLEDVIDVLMADNDRLLKVMLEEELGLTLQAYEHPIKQSLGAFFGSLLAALAFGAAAVFLPFWGVTIAAAVLIGGGAFVAALYQKNDVITAVVWNLAIAGLALGTAFFLIRIL